MAIVFVTMEDLQEIGKEIDIVNGKIAEMDNKVNQLISEINEERKKNQKK